MDWTSLDLLRAHAVESIQFSPSQLRQVLSAYSEGVLRKGWKDYAILSATGQTQFAVVERGAGDQPRILFSIARISQPKKPATYKVFEGEKPVLQTGSFLEALTRFRHLGDRPRPV